MWLTEIQNQTEKCSKLKIHSDNNEYISTLVHSKLSGTEESFGKLHRSCDRKFDSMYINSAESISIWKEKSH